MVDTAGICHNDTVGRAKNGNKWLGMARNGPDFPTRTDNIHDDAHASLTNTCSLALLLLTYYTTRSIGRFDSSPSPWPSAS